MMGGEEGVKGALDVEKRGMSVCERDKRCVCGASGENGEERKKGGGGQQ